MANPVTPNPPPSLLFPPNPSLSPECPKGSILLNRDECNPNPSSHYDKPGILGSLKDAFVWKETGPPMPAATINRTAATTRARSASTATSASSRRSPSPSIRFAPLPDTGLKRTRSITLGVAARSSMLKTQGSSAGGPVKKGAGHYVMMTDEEWEEYQKKMRVDQPAPPDLHLLVAAGTKKLWKKARSFSSSSGTSTTSQSSDSHSSKDTTTSLPQTSIHTIPPLVRAHSDTGPRARLRNLDDVVPEEAVVDEVGSDGGSVRMGRSDSIASSDFGSIVEEEEDVDMEDADADADTSMNGDEEESIDGTPLPSYLQSDMKAERSHFDHEFELQHAREFAPLDHENLSRHLRSLEIEDQGTRRRRDLGFPVVGEEDGGETPRGARTPNHRMGMEGLMSSHSQMQG